MTIRTYTSYTTDPNNVEVKDHDTQKAAIAHANEEAKWENTIFSDVVVDGLTIYIASE